MALYSVCVRFCLRWRGIKITLDSVFVCVKRAIVFWSVIGKWKRCKYAIVLRYMFVWSRKWDFRKHFPEHRKPYDSKIICWMLCNPNHCTVRLNFTFDRFCRSIEIHPSIFAVKFHTTQNKRGMQYTWLNVTFYLSRILDEKLKTQTWLFFCIAISWYLVLFMRYYWNTPALNILIDANHMKFIKKNGYYREYQPFHVTFHTTYQTPDS